MLHRRDLMMRLGHVGMGSLALPTLLEAKSTPNGQRRASAKSVILLYLWGGPPQNDMWDMKPSAPDGIRSHFAPIRTNVPGIDFCEHLPLLAQHADKLCLVRSVTHPSTSHEPSVFRTLTGKVNETLAVPRNNRTRSDFPNFGAFISYLSPPTDLPTTVTIPRPIGHDGATYTGTYAGWLGPRHDPMELREAPNARERYANPIQPMTDLDSSRFVARQGLLRLVDETDRHLQSTNATSALGGFQEQAYRMVSSPAARQAFQLDLESSRLRDRYGRNEYGESFLLARRLVEAGVRLVTCVWMYVTPSGAVSNVWDTHGNVGSLGNVNGFEMLRAHYCLPPLDRAYSALLEDLSQRGLLDETLVVAMGEFGRTPRLNPHLGREHWGPCSTTVLAGGGIPGGTIFGSSDRIGAYPNELPVTPQDVIATIYRQLGIDPHRIVPDREGRPTPLCDGTPIPI